MDAGNKLYGLRSEAYYRQVVDLFAKKTKSAMDTEEEEVIEEEEQVQEPTQKPKRTSANDEMLANFSALKNAARNTLEDPAHLIVDHIDANYVDPLFYKISGKFDDGGYKGLLINNIEVDGNLRYVLYNEKFMERKVASKNTEDVFGSNLMLLSDDISRLSDAMTDEPLCPELATFRELFKKEDDNSMYVETSLFSVALDTSKITIDENISAMGEVDDYGQSLVEEIDNVEAPLPPEREEYPVKTMDVEPDFTYNNTATKFSTDADMDMDGGDHTDYVEYIPNDKITEEDEALSKTMVFQERFDFWNYLEPESWQMSELIRAAEDHEAQSFEEGAHQARGGGQEQNGAGPARRERLRELKRST